jgi:hypothetical protein
VGVSLFTFLGYSATGALGSFGAFLLSFGSFP